MPIKWIILDVDGCISPEESVAWELEPFLELVRLSRAASAGQGSIPPLTLCTGRPQPYVEALMKILDVRAPAICESGAVLYCLADNRARYAGGVSEEKIAGLRAVRCFIESEILPGEPRALIQFGKEAQISVFSERPELLPPIGRRIDEFARRRGGPALHISASHYYLNISLAGVDKGSTLRQLLDELGVKRDQVAGIGDTEGDLPLREAVGFFACPANSTAVIRQAADYVSPYPTTRGILDILRHPRLQR